MIVERETQVVAPERPVAGIPVLITGVQCAPEAGTMLVSVELGQDLLYLLADGARFEAGSLVHFRPGEERQGGVIDLWPGSRFPQHLKQARHTI